MLKLALKITVLFLPLLLVAGYTEYRLRGLSNSYSVKISGLESRAEQIRILVLGSSHALHGIDPSRFELTAFNMANSSQSLFYDLQIVQKELPKLKNLRVVVLPVSYFSLESPLFPSVEDWRCFFYKQYYDISLPEEVDRRYSFVDPRRYSFIGLYGYPESRRRLLKKFRPESTGPDGWYPVTSGSGISDKSGKARVAYHQGGMKKAYIPQSLGYLSEIIQLLKNNGVTPVLVTLPVYATYYNYIDPSSYAAMTLELTRLSRYYGVSYRNYLCDRRFTQDDFFDNDHLNRKGAETFSTVLNADIMSVLTHK